MKFKILGIILVFIGISILGTAGFMRYEGLKKQKELTKAFEETIEKLDKTATTSKQGTDSLQDPVIDMKDIIGIMSIPKINLKVAIAEGVDMETLKSAVGHFNGTAMPGEKDNFCVAGHRSYTYNEFFNRLDEVEIGDSIIIKTQRGEFNYKVYEKLVVEPTEVSVLNSANDATLTLVTCTPIRVATHRLIIKAKLNGLT